MRTIIISDVHDNLTNLEKVLNWAKASNIEALLCLGDVTNSDTVAYILDNFSGQIFWVKGNCDLYERDVFQKHKNVEFFEEIGAFELGGKRVCIGHKPELINKACFINQEGCPDIFLYGHTHRPWIETKNKIIMINPGTLGGVFQKATFAYWDFLTPEPELKILDLLN